MSIFPAKILLATDGSADAELALSTAVDIANSTDSDLHVLTAGPGNPDPSTGYTRQACDTRPTSRRSKRSSVRPGGC